MKQSGEILLKNGPTNQRVKRLRLYTPHSTQYAMHKSMARYRVGAWGRQSGKSTWAVNELIKKAWENPRTNYWFISPTHAQATIMYRRLVGSLWPCREIMLKKNQSELRVKLENLSAIQFKSGDNPDSLRSETLNGVIIDEVRDQDPDLWSMVIQPMLRTTGGWGAFISTPNGYDHFFDIFEAAKNNPRWQTFHAPSNCNPLFTQEELEDARENMSEAQFAQEIMAEFRDMSKGRVYVNYDVAIHERAESPFAIAGETISPHLPIVVGLDFNISPMAWVLGQNRVRDWYWHDEISLHNSHTQEAAKVLIAKVQDHKPGVILVGDASGNARQRAAAGKSDYDIVCQALDSAGIKWVNRTPDANPPIRDRVNAVNAAMKAADGSVHWWHHPRCKALKKDCQRVVWKEGEQIVFDKSDPDLTHSSDAAGYPVCELTPVPGIQKVGGLKVIVR